MMATITGKSLINTVQVALQDPDSTHWTRTELLDYLNDGQREAVILKPDISVVEAPMRLTPGTVKQTLPDGAMSLVDVVCNAGTDGLTLGRSIRIISRELLDAQHPGWRSESNSGAIQHYMYDPQNPKNFYVYPKASASQSYVEIVYCAIPDNTDDVSKVIGIDDIYANALVNYMMYRAFAKDGQAAQNASLASAYYSLFSGAFGIKDQVDAGKNPNLSVLQFNPNVPGSAKV